MIYGSVCSGIEAATVAWHPLGWKPAFFSEIDKFPRAVLAHHYPGVPLHGDFTTIGADEYGSIDLLVGGTPCQSFSLAGLRGGLGDDRGNLSLEYLRLAARKRPRWLVWENVPGVLSSGGGRDFGAILGGMAELGYGFAYRVLDAQYVRTRAFPWAVPQRRRRVFVVGCLGDWRRAAAVLFDRESLHRHPAPRRKAGQVAAGTLRARTKGGGGLGTDFELAGGLVANFGDVSYCISASGQQSLDAETETETETLIAFDPCQITSKANRSNPQPGDPRHTIPAQSTPPMIAFSCKDSGGDASENVAPTLRSMGHNTSHANGGGQIAVAIHGDVAHTLSAEGHDASEDGTGRGTPVIGDGWRVRRLMPVECERLQGFPDGYTDIPWRGKYTAPDGRRYKAIGNSMAVNVMQWIGQRIDMVDKL